MRAWWRRLVAMLTISKVARIAVVQVAPTDVVIVECDRHLSDLAERHMMECVRATWPGRKVLVVEQGIRIHIAPE